MQNTDKWEIKTGALRGKLTRKYCCDSCDYNWARQLGRPMNAHVSLPQLALLRNFNGFNHLRSYGMQTRLQSQAIL